jgi:hypothetical protein
LEEMEVAFLGLCCGCFLVSLLVVHEIERWRGGLDDRFQVNYM